MPSSSERRLIQWFINGYNTCHEPKITRLHADDKQEAPDAICELDNNSVVALELTSFGSPKGTSPRHIPNCYSDLHPLIKTMHRKLNNDYRLLEAHEVWLLVHLRYTLTRELVEEATKDLLVPSRFDRIYFEWPLPEKTEKTSINVLELPTHRFWTPDLPRPNRFGNKLCIS